jgi:peptidoglycan-associated lipoprotein
MRKILYFAALLSAICSLQSCARTGNEVWDDTKSAGRHLKRSVCALGGSHNDSRQIRSRADFECINDSCGYEEPCYQDCDYQNDSCQQGNPYQMNYQDFNNQPIEYVPLDDPSNDLAMNDNPNRQARETPGEYGSSIPGIEAFRDPHTIPHLAGLFQNIYFEYDSSLVKGAQNLQTVHNVAEYLRQHPHTYLFIEGHTDERGPQAYNLALGVRRSNAVRNLLLKEGVNPDNVFTISYGKDRPLVLDRHEEGWAKNRRAEFKIYER